MPCSPLYSQYFSRIWWTPADSQMLSVLASLRSGANAQRDLAVLPLAAGDYVLKNRAHDRQGERQ